MVVHPCSHRVSRVRRYSGYPLTVIGFRLRDSHPLWSAFPGRSTNLYRFYVGPNPEKPEGLSVWPLPRSLATTSGISVDVFSSPYLDVSVQAVPRVHLFYSMHADRVLLCRVSPFGYLRIVAYVPLPEAFRSLSRPSSAPDAKAFPLRSFLLDLASSRTALSSRPACAVRSPAPSLLLSATNPLALGFVPGEKRRFCPF
jgi:hypothetical protein